MYYLSRIILSSLLLVTLAVQAGERVTLKQAITSAQQNDPWLHGNQLKQQAVMAKSVSAGTLADPKVSISMMNLPTNSWDFNQEAMTQFSVGVSQLLPRGNSLALKQDQLAIEASKYPLLRSVRKAQVATKVSQLWLDAYLAQKTIALIQQNQTLFSQIVEITEGNYANAFANTRQQDVLQAQLELLQLEEKLTVQQQNFDRVIAQLKPWLQPYDAAADNFEINFASQRGHLNVSEQLPEITLIAKNLLKHPQLSANQLAEKIAFHPALMAIDVNYQAAAKGITLAKQKYQPQWGVNASYGLRDDAPSGVNRADLFSMGVSFDVPLFTTNKQDQDVAATVANSQAIKTDKLLLLKKMVSEIDLENRNLKRLTERQALYQQQLLLRSQQQAEATLSAYTNDDGDFTDVARARIVELNTGIAALVIDVERLKTIVRLNYFFVSTTVPAH